MGKLFDVVCDLNKHAANKGYAAKSSQTRPLPVKKKHIAGHR